MVEEEASLRDARISALCIERENKSDPLFVETVRSQYETYAIKSTKWEQEYTSLEKLKRCRLNAGQVHERGWKVLLEEQQACPPPVREKERFGSSSWIDRNSKLE